MLREKASSRGDIGLAIGAAVDAVLAVEEIGHRLVGAGELREDVGDRVAREIAIGDRDRLADPVAEPQGGVEPGALLPGQRGAVDAAQPRQMIEQRLIAARLAGRPGHAEPALQEGALAGVEAEPGRRLRRGAQHALEDAVVERARRGGGGAGAMPAQPDSASAPAAAALIRNLAAVEIGHVAVLTVPDGGCAPAPSRSSSAGARRHRRADRRAPR